MQAAEIQETADPSAELKALYHWLVWQTEMGADEVIGDFSPDRRISATGVLQDFGLLSTPSVSFPQPRDLPQNFSQVSALSPAEPSLNSGGLSVKETGVVQASAAFGIFRAENKGVAEAEALAKAARTLEELEEALAAFTACSLKNTAKNTVFADGVRHPQLMVIGEAPGAEEDRTGKPFVGPAGQLLDKMLAAIGQSRAETVRISNIIPWRPPGNRTPTPVEAALCKPFILRHIELAAPSVIFLTGAVAAQTLSGKSEGITRLRGHWFELSFPESAKKIPALAGFHPAYLLRLPKAKKQAWSDLCLLAQKTEEIKKIESR